MKYLLQYHNFEFQGGFPAAFSFDGKKISDNEKLSDISHSITSSKKKLVLNAKGDTIFLIIGIKIKQGENKKYFLWSETVINQDEPKTDEEGRYDLIGKQHWLYPPQYLNIYERFDYFLHKSGNFSVCMVDISTWEFTQKLIELSKEYKCKDPQNITFGQFKDDFRREVKRRVP
jgi:hypothetical protein